MPMALGLGLGLPYIAAASGPYPALDLLFTSGTLDSRVTYSGASLATLTDATGAIAYKPHNLLTRSAVSTTNWSLATNVTVTAGTVADPEGALTGATVSWGAASAGNGVLKVVSGVNGTANTKAIYVRADVAGGTVELVDPGTTAGATVATLTTAWQRVSLSEVAGTQLASGGVWLRKTASSPATVYVCWATFNLGSLQPYYPTTGSAYFGPRFTYDPVTHAALGLLIEEQRTNLLTYSEAFDNAAWAKTRSSVSVNSTAAPDGSSSADFIVEDSTAANSHFVANSLTISSATAYTLSIYAKANGRSWIALYESSAGKGKYFNISTGAVGGTLIGAPTSYSITDVGNGWYRCSITVTSAGTSGSLSVYLANADGGFSYNGDGTSGVYVWGAQLEAGAFATTYIPTTSASVTRAADSATMTGSNFSSWFNATQGTFVVDAQFGVVGPPSDLILAHDGSATNSVGIYMSSSKPNQAVNAGGVSQTVQASGSAWTLGATSKVAASFAANDFRTSNNGAAVVTDSVGSMPSGLNAFSLGGSGAVLYAGTKLNATIARLRYYNTALTNAQLQALTT